MSVLALVESLHYAYFTNIFRYQVWLRIDSSRHPATGRKTHRQIENEIYKEALTQGALVIPGSWFQPQRDIEQGGVFFRVSFALPSAEKMEEAIRRFGVALRSCFSLD